MSKNKKQQQKTSTPTPSNGNKPEKTTKPNQSDVVRLESIDRPTPISGLRTNQLNANAKQKKSKIDPK